VTVDLLRHSYFSLKREAAAGVDDVTWREYGEKLEERLPGLHDRVHSGHYQAKPSKRIWIPKSETEQRPIGIAALEDKIVQQALATVLQQIYEVDFLGFSYGSRPGRSQHNALDAVYVAITQKKVSWVLDVDIRKFYDSLDHEWLMKFVGHRVTDQRILRLLRKFLRAGVSEDGEWSKTVVGTPQGAVISALLANVFLHYTLDLWVEQWRSRYARGEVYIVRYADDFVMGFQYRSDAEQFQTELKERLAKFSLEMHEGKTKLIEFGRFAIEDRKKHGEGKPETFDFLGFTHICARKKNGRFTIYRKTITKRLRDKIKKVREILLRKRHRPVSEQGAWLRAVMQGHFNYYGVPGNRKALDTFRKQIQQSWLQALRRRSQKARSLTWERMKKLIGTWLPTARVVHPYPNQRLCV
jgi:group II intron reverse transcriptase/maturase